MNEDEEGMETLRSGMGGVAGSREGGAPRPWGGRQRAENWPNKKMPRRVCQWEEMKHFIEERPLAG